MRDAVIEEIRRWEIEGCMLEHGRALAHVAMPSPIGICVTTVASTL